MRTRRILTTPIFAFAILIVWISVSESGNPAQRDRVCVETGSTCPQFNDCPVDEWFLPLPGSTYCSFSNNESVCSDEAGFSCIGTGPVNDQPIGSCGYKIDCLSGLGIINGVDHEKCTYVAHCFSKPNGD